MQTRLCLLRTTLKEYYFSQEGTTFKTSGGEGAVIVPPELDQKCFVQLKMQQFIFGRGFTADTTGGSHNIPQIP